MFLFSQDDRPVYRNKSIAVNNVERPPSATSGQHACTKCGKHFARKESLNNHMQLHTRQFKYYCELCRKGYSGLAPFQVHMDKHKGIKYQCEYCPKAFSKTQDRDYHHSVHTGQYRFTCDGCGKGFNNGGPYEQHRKTHDQLEQRSG